MMKTKVRQKYIVELLRQNSKLEYGQLGVILGVSVDTVRRDINQLERIGLATKILGGVQLRSNISSRFNADKESLHQNSKLLAQRSAKLVKPGDVVVFD